MNSSVVWLGVWLQVDILILSILRLLLVLGPRVGGLLMLKVFLGKAVGIRCIAMGDFHEVDTIEILHNDILGEAGAICFND